MSATVQEMPAGRPGEGKKRTVILDDEDHSLVCDLADGSFTAGVVRMIDIEREKRSLPPKIRRPRKRIVAKS